MSKPRAGETSTKAPEDHCQGRANAYVRQATGLLARNDFRQALEFCNLAIQQDAKCGRAYLIKGFALFKLEKPEESVKSIKLGLSLLPAKGEGVLMLPGHGPEWSYHTLVIALIDLGKYQEGLDSLDDAPASYQKTTTFLEDRGSLCIQLKHYDKAVEWFSQAIKSNPTNNYLYRERARAYLVAKKPAQALVDFTYAINQEPKESSLYAGRGESYKLLGKMELSKQDYARANELGKSNDFSPLLEPISK
jgi:tetratricopeptide (TPR) repeat protein